MKKTKVIPCLLAVTLIAASFAGCGDSASVSTEEISLKQEQQQPQDQRGTMAKVVSLEGDTITVLLADIPAGKDGGTPPSDESRTTDGALQTGGKTPSDGAQPPAEGNQENGGPQGGGPGQGGGQIQFTGEQVTYILSNDIKITKGMGDSATEIDLSEVAADSLIRFTTTTDNDGNEEISSIQVIE